jgi:hypothetical protein
MASERVVGAPVLPSSSKINRCNTLSCSSSPAKTPANPRKCYTCGGDIHRDVCPNFCEVVLPCKPEPYTGPDVIGTSHMAKLGGPVR